MEQLLMVVLDAIPWFVYVLAALGALVVLGRAYIYLTPSQKDDEWYAKLESHPIWGLILNTLVKFSPVQRTREDAKTRSTDK